MYSDIPFSVCTILPDQITTVSKLQLPLWTTITILHIKQKFLNSTIWHKTILYSILQWAILLSIFLAFFRFYSQFTVSICYNWILILQVSTTISQEDLFWKKNLQSFCLLHVCWRRAAPKPRLRQEINQLKMLSIQMILFPLPLIPD